MKKLASSRVIVFGLGGVGGYVVEALTRSGIGALDLVDHDVISESNINRQILATINTIGRKKVDVAAERVASINPDCQIKTYDVFFLPDTQDLFDFHDYDYVVDAIDTVTGKLAIIEKAKKEGVPVISAMGAGNKIDPSAFRVADLYETSVCPLARIMRRECKKRGIDSLKVVYSCEKPHRALVEERKDSEDSLSDSGQIILGKTDAQARVKQVPGSTAFTPSVAGLILAGEVVNDLVQS